MSLTVGNPIQALEEGFEVDGWRVRPHANTFEQRDSRVCARVNSKSMQVFVALAASAGEFVSKETLINTVWAGRVVTDDVLTGAVRILRRALNDDARKPRVIETRKGVGYRLIKTVRPLIDTRPVYRRPGWRLAAGVLIASALAMTVATYVRLVDRTPATIAVLPFDSLSVESRDTYLASAMTDALIVNLAKGDRFRVISRTSILPYANQEKSMQAIATELGADYVVEGSVITSDGRLRISAQLVDGRDDGHLWAASYDRELDDILAIQKDVSNQIVRQIVGTVSDVRPTPEPGLAGEPLETLLKARYLLAQEKVAPAREAYTMFQRLARDHPTSSDGHLGMAQVQLLLFKAYEVSADALDAAAASARTALELNPERAEIYRCLGQIVQFKDWDFRRAASMYQRAIEINPSDTVARRRFAWLLVAVQRYADAQEQIDHIRLLDPRYYVSADGAMLQLFAGLHDRAVAELERLNREEPGSARTLRILSLGYWAMGRYDESAAALMQSRIAAGNPSDELRAAFEAGGRTGLFRYLLAADVFRAPVSIAALHAQLGDDEAALGWLERAVAERDPNILFARVRPELVALQDNPRFKALMTRVNRAR